MVPETMTSQQLKINKFFKMYPTRDKSKEGCYFLDGKSFYSNPYKHSILFEGHMQTGTSHIPDIYILFFGFK